MGVQAVDRIEILEGLVLHASGVCESLRSDRATVSPEFSIVKEGATVHHPPASYGSPSQTAG